MTDGYRLLLALSCLMVSGGCAVRVPKVVEALPVNKVSAAAKSKTAKAPLSGTQVRYFKGGQSLPPFAKTLQIEAMAFRSLTADPADQEPEQLKNDGLVDKCLPGRADLDFIQSVNVGVRHSDEKDTDAVVVATYAQAQKGLCGFHLTPTYSDMKDYAEDYVFVIQVTGTEPPGAVSMSGYYSVQDYEGL